MNQYPPGANPPPSSVNLGFARVEDEHAAVSAPRWRKLQSLLELGEAGGRVRVIGSPGSGKTAALEQACHELREQGRTAFYSSLDRLPDSAWHSPTVQSLHDLLADSSESADSTLSIRSSPSVCVFDGLSDVPRDSIPRFIDAMNRFALRYPAAVVVTADLPVPRAEFSKRWAFAVVGERGESGVVVAPLRSLLAVLATRSGSLGEQVSTSLLEPILLDRYRLTREHLVELENLALECFAPDGRNQLPLRRAVTLARNAIEPALERGLLDTTNDFVRFKWRMAQDYLAARRVSRDKRLWREECFARITQKGSYLEPLAMVREALPDEDARNEFVRQVYPWSYVGAAYALRRLGGERRTAASRDLEAAILFQLSQRIEDEFDSTAEAAALTMAAIAHPLSPKLSKAKGLGSRLEIIDDYVGGQTSDWYLRWRGLAEGSPRIDHRTLLASLQEQDSILAWSASNAMSRGCLPGSSAEALVHLARHDRQSAVRWRAAHALARTPREDVVELLGHLLLHDDDRWVRRGAVRSLLEIGLVGSDPVRSAVLQLLAGQDTIGVIAGDADLLLEFTRASVPRIEEDPAWLERLAAVFGAIWADEDDEYRREALERTARTLNRMVAESGTVGGAGPKEDL